MKLFSLFFIVIFLPIISKAQLCSVAKQDLSARIEFVEGLQKTHRRDLVTLERTVRMTRDTLKAMKNAHLASDISQTVAAVAGLIAGGYAISSLYFTGESVGFLGLTIQPGTLAAHAYSTYSIGNNLATLGQVGWSIWKDEKTPEEYLQNQMNQLRDRQIFSPDATLFITAANWSGWSDKLQSPLIKEAFSKLDKFYKDNVREIGDKGGWWSYVGEFWHEKGLKRSALDSAVAIEATHLQKMRIAYFDLLKHALEEHRKYCY